LARLGAAARDVDSVLVAAADEMKRLGAAPGVFTGG
jgi:hypothetical protein